MRKYIIVLGKVFGFLLIYVILFYGLSILFFKIMDSNYFYSDFMRPIIRWLSLLSPVAIYYGDTFFGGVLASGSFNILFCFFNIVYSYLVYRIILKLIRNFKKNKQNIVV